MKISRFISLINCVSVHSGPIISFFNHKFFYVKKSENIFCFLFGFCGSLLTPILASVSLGSFGQVMVMEPSVKLMQETFERIVLMHGRPIAPLNAEEVAQEHQGLVGRPAKRAHDIL